MPGWDGVERRSHWQVAPNKGRRESDKQRQRDNEEYAAQRSSSYYNNVRNAGILGNFREDDEEDRQR